MLENIFDAARAGAAVVNYVRGEANAATDVFTGDRFTVRARQVVDATGPWESTANVRLVRGSHLLFPRLTAGDHAIAFFEEAGRIVFVIPWPGSAALSLVGTTDCDHTGGPDKVHIAPEEVRYLRDIVNRLFPGAGNPEPVAAFSALRPLLQSGTSATRASREHRIWKSPDGVLHVAGGKYSTYRAIAEQVAERICREIAPAAAGMGITSQRPLGGNTHERLEAVRGTMTGEPARLIADYGVAAPNVLAWLPHWGKPSRRIGFASPFAYPTVGVDSIAAARIAYAAHHEMVQRLPDLLFVSTTWGYERKWDAAALEPVATELGRHWNWDRARLDEEIALALRLQ